MASELSINCIQYPDRCAQSDPQGGYPYLPSAVREHFQELFFDARQTAINNRTLDISDRRGLVTQPPNAQLVGSSEAPLRPQANQPALEIGGFSFSWTVLLIVALVLFFIFD